MADSGDNWLHRLLADGSLGEMLVSGMAALGAVFLVGWGSAYWLQDFTTTHWLLASMGASATLILAVPQGPMSQPWPFMGGHFLSGASGVLAAWLVPEPHLAGALAVGLAVSAMYVFRCLHPPGGATALFAVIGGEQVHQLGYQYLLEPLAPNLILMMIWVMIVNNLLPGRRYPNSLRRYLEQRKSEPKQAVAKPFAISREDLNKALHSMGSFVDVAGQDLEAIFRISAGFARQRLMKELTCGSIMSDHPVSVYYHTEIEKAWNTLWRHRIRSLPVVDHKDRLIGILTIADFLNQANSDMADAPLAEKLARFVKRTTGTHTAKPEYVGHVMTRNVVSVLDSAPILDLFVIFAQHNVHHLPVVNEQNVLVGMLTPKNLLKALQIELGTDHLAADAEPNPEKA